MKRLVPWNRKFFRVDGDKKLAVDRCAWQLAGHLASGASTSMRSAPLSSAMELPMYVRQRLPTGRLALLHLSVAFKGKIDSSGSALVQILHYPTKTKHCSPVHSLDELNNGHRLPSIPV